MKKLIAIIIILLVVLIGIFAYQKMAIHTNEIKIEEIEKIETYISQIYMWKEITKEALPYFENINQADELWIWEVVKRNLEEYEITKETIEKKAKEIFGEKFNKPFPEQGTESLIADEQRGIYYATGTDLDEQEDMFLLNKIEKTKTGYEVEIIEYLEDYSLEETEQDIIVVRNIEEKEIGRTSSKEEEKIKELVKENSNQLSKKKIILKAENEKLEIEKVERNE